MYAIRSYYGKGLTNSEIAAYLFESGYKNEPVICDSAEPKSIVELQLLGINAIGADKKPRITSYNVCYTKLLRKIPGMTADAKQRKNSLINEVFGTLSWTKVENSSSDKLKSGLEKLRQLLKDE